MDLRCSFNKNTYLEFLNYLNSLSDFKYKEFHQKNVKSDNVIGIRTNILKKLAKEISIGDYKSFIECNTSLTYEAIMIEGFIYTYLKIPFQELTFYIDKYLLKANTWCHIDLLVSNLKIIKKNEELGFKYAKKLIHSKKEFIKRCGIIILLNYYLHDIYIDKALELVFKVKSNDYYVKMAIAWFMSSAYIKYKEKTLVYLVNIKDDFIYNKTLSKITDSTRISKEEKKFIKSLKRVNKNKVEV